MTVHEMKQERAELIARAREILDTAEREKRGLTEEEKSNSDAAMRRAMELKADAERQDTLDRLEAEITSNEQRGLTRIGGDSPEAQGEKQHRDAFLEYVRFGGEAQFRALQVDQDSKGGYLVPAVMATEILKNVDDLVFVRRLATVQQIPTADSLGIPYLAADPSDADWTSELGTGNEDTTMSFGKRELRPHPLAKRIRISNTLLRKATNVESFVQARLAYKFGISQEKAFMTGSGAGQPLGVFTASNDGVPTSRDISTGNTSTSVKLDGLYNAKYALKQQYWPRAQWVFHRDVVAQIAKLKDGEGRYLWTESTRVGEPDRLLGIPVNMSEYAPNTLTTGLYAGILADFSNYYIADALSISVQRLSELYAENNQTGYIARVETDGMPVLAEAFARVTLA